MESGGGSEVGGAHIFLWLLVEMASFLCSVSLIYYNFLFRFPKCFHY